MSKSPPPPKPEGIDPNPRHKPKKQEVLQEPNALASLSRTHPTPAEFKKLWVDIGKDSDRAAALMASTYVEGFLRFWILGRFIPIKESKRKQLIKKDGILSSFSSVIELGLMLGLIGPVIYRDLSIIRNIRNAFAHALKPIDFKTPEVQAEIDKLSFAKTVPSSLSVLEQLQDGAVKDAPAVLRAALPTTWQEMWEKKFISPRQRYVLSCQLIASAMSDKIDFSSRPRTLLP